MSRRTTPLAPHLSRAPPLDAQAPVHVSGRRFTPILCPLGAAVCRYAACSSKQARKLAKRLRVDLRRAGAKVVAAKLADTARQLGVYEIYLIAECAKPDDKLCNSGVPAERLREDERR